MLHQDYPSTTDDQYKEGKESLKRIVEFCEKFSMANKELLDDHDAKIKAKKSTRRFKPSIEFRQMTELLDKLMSSFDNVYITPINARRDYTLREYYSK